MTNSNVPVKAIADLPGRIKVLSRNEFLKKGGVTDQNVYLIQEGSIRVFVCDGVEEQIIRFGYAGNIIVALDSYLSGKPSALYMQAIKRTLVKVIPKAELDNFLKEDTNKLMWIAILENLVLQQMEREIDILTSSPAQRYERVLRRSPQLFQEIPHKHIASYLRMTPETLSRLKKS